MTIDCKYIIVRLEVVFIVSAALLLLVTGGAKVFSVTGAERILDTQDAVFTFLSTRELLILVALLELAVACVALLPKTPSQSKLFLVAWLGSLFGLYRLGLWLVGYQPCKCLGGAMEWTGLSDTAIRGITFGMFVYLLCGAGVLLLVKACIARTAARQIRRSPILALGVQDSGNT